MIENKIKSTPILYGEDAKRFEEALENPRPVSKEEIERMLNTYKTIRKGLYSEDDLRCCGNCIHDGLKCHNDVHNKCDSWEWDNFTEGDRKQ